LAGSGGISFESFALLLPFRPSDEKKPPDDLPDLADLGEVTNRGEGVDERDVLVDDWEPLNGDGCAKDGYGRAGGP
jgi:hypothetical protein